MIQSELYGNIQRFINTESSIQWSNIIGGEQGLNPYETCCLAEIFLPNIESKEELMDVALLQTFFLNKKVAVGNANGTGN